MGCRVVLLGERPDLAFHKEMAHIVRPPKLHFRCVKVGQVTLLTGSASDPWHCSTAGTGMLHWKSFPSQCRVEAAYHHI